MYCFLSFLSVGNRQDAHQSSAVAGDARAHPARQRRSAAVPRGHHRFPTTFHGEYSHKKWSYLELYYRNFLLFVCRFGHLVGCCRLWTRRQQLESVSTTPGLRSSSFGCSPCMCLVYHFYSSVREFLFLNPFFRDEDVAIDQNSLK